MARWVCLGTRSTNLRIAATVINGVDTEALLANLSEPLASANAMLSDLTFDLEGSRRHIALGIQQLIELSGQLANRALDKVEARPST
ncbi:hypothetical protein CD58_10525 [Pseudomonas brassicacearum]|nr:hypothetical protein CD58_10525 [Pseudomonas brassicacearum]